ncbi:UTR1 (Associated with ferric reductase activity) [Madurella fahalii]|uniref:UTR1 (Associated with ferric reductase activity) n=1 Tax=Madurella fahalii TaxID=1157608 RepID=A0ABQ0G8Q9_9PEZI
MADITDSHRRVSFEESASDEDRNSVEVVFDPANPYRRKCSLIGSESIPPHLRRAIPPPHKTECLVHQFLANQQRSRQSHPQHTAPDGDGHRHHDSSPNIHRIRHHEDGTSTCQADDISSEAGLDRPVDPKDIKSNSDGNTSASNPQSARPRFTTTLKHTVSARDIDSNASNENAGDLSSSTCGQADEKQWRAEMMSARTPSQLGARSASADAPNSRLLTKKQLSEMAWGVRELSRRLGSMRLRFRVKSIFLLTKIYDPELIVKTRELCRWLLDREREVRYTIYVDRELKENKRFDVAGLVEEVRRDYVASGEVSEEASWDVAKRLRYWDEGMCRARPHTFDFVVTLGGDGTVLYASWLFQRIVPPVLSFALGSLGFLTKFDFDDYKKTLTNAFNEGVTVSLRLRFEATIMRSQKTRSMLTDDGEHVESTEEGKEAEGGSGAIEQPRDLVEELIGEEKDDEHTHWPDGTYEVLNEVVVDRGPNPTMSNIEIFGDDEHFTSVSADGICVSTPTGSTAYNLAAGGSLCHPENPVMLVTSICAHTLSFRPVILPDTIVLRIGVPYDARASSWASFDGRERVELRPGDYVTVSASRYPFACVQPHGRRSEDWINSISAKLGWNTRQRQKAFKEWEK